MTLNGKAEVIITLYIEFFISIPQYLYTYEKHFKKSNLCATHHS